MGGDLHAYPHDHLALYRLPVSTVKRVHVCLVEVTQAEYVNAHSVCQLVERQPNCAVPGRLSDRTLAFSTVALHLVQGMPYPARPLHGHLALHPARGTIKPEQLAVSVNALGGKIMIVDETLSRVQFVVDQQGQTTGVLLSIEIWQALLVWLEELENKEDKRLLRERLPAGRFSEAPGMFRWDKMRAESVDDRTA